MELSEKESELYDKFKAISDMAYQREPLKSYAPVLDQLAWYKMKEVYEEYRKGNYSLEEAKKRRDKVAVFYEQQTRIQNFDKELHDERYKHVIASEHMLKGIMQSIKDRAPEKELLEKLIDYVVELTGIVPIKTEYKETYEVK